MKSITIAIFVLFCIPTLSGLSYECYAYTKIRKQTSVCNQCSEIEKSRNNLRFLNYDKNRNFYRDLAAYWSPIIYQQVDKNGYNSLEGKSDYITKFDYDNDFKGYNNWENVPNFPLKSYVYYDVKETNTHWFIYYAIYHPRDWENGVFQYVLGTTFGTFQHENDLEGILMVIRKQGKYYGEIEIIESMGHNVWFNYPNPLKTTNNKIILKQSFFNDSAGSGVHFETSFEPRGIHPIAYVQSRGHAIFFSENKRYYATIGNLRDNGIDDWVHEKSFHGIVYKYTGYAQEPEKAINNIVGYDLIEITELWKLKENDNTFSSSMNGLQAFRGESPFWGPHDDNRANPPWTTPDYYNCLDHKGADCYGLPRKIPVTPPGTFFLDPVEAIRARYHISDFSLNYVYSMVSPIPIIHGNGLRKSLTIDEISKLNIKVTFLPGKQEGMLADWWIVTSSADGMKSLISESTGLIWKTGIHRCVVMPARSFFDVSIPSPSLSKGANSIIFAVDENADGKPDASWWDSINIFVK